jgi:hypothetical protein
MIKFVLEPFEDDIGDKPLDRPPETCRLLDKVGTGVKPLVSRHEKDGLDVPVEAPVDQGHLKFIFKIGYGPESPQNDIRPLALDIID